MYDVVFWDDVISFIRLAYTFNVIHNNERIEGEKIGELRPGSVKTTWTCRVSRGAGTWTQISKDSFDLLEQQIYSRLGIPQWLSASENANAISMVRDIHRPMPNDINLRNRRDSGVF